MRDYNSTYEWDDNPYAESSDRGSGSLRTIALVGAVALIAAPLIVTFMQRRRTAEHAAQTEPEIDEALKDTYPASDPPASHFFEIPENRQ